MGTGEDHCKSLKLRAQFSFPGLKKMGISTLRIKTPMEFLKRFDTFLSGTENSRNSYVSIMQTNPGRKTPKVSISLQVLVKDISPKKLILAVEKRGWVGERRW